MLAIDIDGIDCELSFETPEAGMVYFTQLGTKVNASAPYDVVNKQSLDNRLRGYAPTTRTINGHALSANITLDADDVGAATEAQVEAAKPMLVTISGSDGSYTADKTPAEIIAAYQAGQTVYAVYNNVRVPMCELLDGYICIFTLDYGSMYDVFIYEYEGSVVVEASVTSTKPLLRTATLTTSGWSSNSQTVTVNGVVANSSAQLIYVSPANKDSATAWGEAGVFCSAQGANSLTFVCDSTPSANISVNISIQEAQT